MAGWPRKVRRGMASELAPATLLSRSRSASAGRMMLSLSMNRVGMGAGPGS